MSEFKTSQKIQDEFIRDYNILCKKYARTLTPILQFQPTGITPGLNLIEVDPATIKVDISPELPKPQDHLPKAKKEKKGE
jgi:hypothetical protein